MVKTKVVNPEKTAANSETDALNPEQQAVLDWQVCLALASRSMLGNYVYVMIFLTLYWVDEMNNVHPDMMFYTGVGMVVLSMMRGFITVQIESWQTKLQAWKAIFFALTIAITALWSGITLHHWSEFGINEHTMLLLLVVMGITFGALPVLSLHQNLFRSFALVLYLPLIIYGYMQDDGMSLAVANILLIGLVFSFSTSAKLSKEFRKNLELTLRMQGKEAKINRLAAQARDESAAKSTFLANMSHEIRTPMNGVMGMTEMLQKTALSEKQGAYVQVIHRSADALLSIINDILDYSKMESGHLHLETLPFHLRDTMDDVMALMAHKGMDKGLEVILDISPETPDAFVGDAGRIRQMLINLIGNAFKFTQEGEVQVSIATELVEDNIHWLRFTVLDTGIGIPEAAQQKIFDSFSQADNTTTRRFGGTGLGLAICFQLASLMDGEIHLESTAGECSRFSFIIPLQWDSQASQAPMWDKKMLKAMAEKTVLIVDDNDNTRRTLCHQLSAWNIKYSAVDSAIEAWEILTHQPEEQRFAIALLDMHMAGINGLDLSSMIRAHHDLSTMRLVMLCSQDGDAEAIKMSSAFIDDYIAKPIGQRVLFQALSNQAKHPEEAAEDPSKSAQETTDCDAEDVSLADSPCNLNILIAEDNPVNQQVLVAMLELLGCHAEVANNGMEVLSALDNQQFDVILMDCHMPQMDGLEATRQIRQRQTPDSGVTIVALTANAMPEDRERCIQAGMDDYLSKPFTQKQLKKIMDTYSQTTCDDCSKDCPCASEQEASLVSQQVEALSQQDCPVLDETCIQNLAQLQQTGRVNILHKVMQMYVEDAPQHLQRMRDAIPAHDSQALSIAAHTLKSSSANIGALHLSEICMDIEQLSSQAWDREPMLRYVQQAESSYDLVSSEIIIHHLPSPEEQAQAMAEAV